MTTENTAPAAQKKAKCSMITWGITYLFLFPFLFYIFAGFAEAISTNASFSRKLIGLTILLPIFAMPLSFFLMWFSYSKAYYKIVRLCWIIPILFFALVLLVHIILALV